MDNNQSVGSNLGLGKHRSNLEDTTKVASIPPQVSSRLEIERGFGVIEEEADLQNVVSDIAKNTNTNKGVGKPQNYDRKQSDDARCFLAAFELWAQGVQALADDEKKRIKSAISFLEGEAAIWATPISENIAQGGTLTYPD